MDHPPPLVCTHGDQVSLQFRQGEIQSLMSLQQPMDLVLPYTRTMMGFLLLVQKPAHILMIGLGGGSLAKYCYHQLAETRMTVVEINPRVIAMRQQFQVPADNARFEVVCADGADFVRETRQRFDAILVDGFDEDGQSDQLTSMAFYENAYRVLRPNGAIAINLDSDHPAHCAFLERVNTCFRGNMVVIGVPERANHIVFAAKGLPISLENMRLSAAAGKLELDAPMPLRSELQRIFHPSDHAGRFPDIDEHAIGRPP